MMSNNQKFMREFIKSIKDGNAAIFAGAGLSRPSGLVEWKELLRPLAEDIGLNIDEEHDLTLVAQYVKNKSGNRSAINSSIIESFCKEVEINENIKILTKLPIYTYWTTNYDHLLEEGLKNANRNADVKIEYKQLTNTKRDRDAVVYKMHGDADHPADAVLTKDDYVQYDKKYPFFRKVLQGDLISKTFLFIGFSFEDPNFDYVLSQTRLLLEDNIRDHYCIMRKINRKDIASDEEYGYKLALEELRKEDLARQGIKTVFVNEFSEITDMLRKIERAILANNVFVSGSIAAYDDSWTKEKVDEFCYKLSKRLIKEDYRVTSGFGVGIGSSIINGAMDEIYSSKYRHMDEHICLRPFPQGISDNEERMRRWTEYRTHIFEENGIAIFLFGNKIENENTVIADGCLQEFEIAKKFGCTIIPIGSTGYAAGKIFDEIMDNKEQYDYLQDKLEILERETDIEKLIDTILFITNKQRI